MMAVLLRLMLVASLVLNGSGAAMAAVSMPPIDTGPVARAGHGAPLPAAAKPPCHMQMADTSSTGPAPATTGDTDIAKHGGMHPDSGCRGQGGCHCACQQQALTVALDVETRLLRAAELQTGSVPAHPEPLLQDRIRPPIA